MFAFKLSLVAPFILLISITYNVFATPEEYTCRELIKREFYFEDADDAGQQNFINAFTNLSFDTIAEKFKKPNDIVETDSQIKERELQHKLTKSYFEDLFKDHGLDISELDYISNWCEKTINIAKNITFTFKENMVIENLDELYDCVAFTLSLLNDREEAFIPTVIFQRLYEDWTLYNVSNIKLLGYDVTYFLDKQVMGEEYVALKNKVIYNAKTYSLEFFKYYETFVKELDPEDGNFRSIKEYCAEIGHTLVSQNGFLLN